MIIKKNDLTRPVRLIRHSGNSFTFKNYLNFTATDSFLYTTYTCTETSKEYQIICNDIEYTFSKLSDTLSSASINGFSILSQPMHFNFFRAPIDNDRLAQKWEMLGLHNYTTKVYEHSFKVDEGIPSLTFSLAFGEETHEPFARVKATYRFVKGEFF